MSSSRKPGTKSARFESSCITSHISMALQTIGDIFFLIATYRGLTYILTTFSKVYTYTQTNTWTRSNVVDVFQTTCISGNFNGSGGRWKFLCCVKNKDVIHGLWVWLVCLIPGRDTSSKPWCYSLTFDESLMNSKAFCTICITRICSLRFKTMLLCFKLI